MKGKPKYKENDNVTFTFNGELKDGVVFIVDKWGVFENPSDVHYDIFVENENMLYKHIIETDVQ